MKNTFRKITTAALFGLCLAGCSEHSILSEGLSSIEGNISLYSFKEKYASLENLTEYSSFFASDELPFSLNSPSAFFFDCSSPDFTVSTEILDRLYDYFGAAQYAYVMFYKAPDFSFFAGSKFDNEKHNYDSGSEALTYFYNDAIPGYVNSSGYTLVSPKEDVEEKMIDTLVTCLAKIVKSNKEKM